MRGGSAATQQPDTDSRQEGGQPSTSTADLTEPTQTCVEGADEEEMNIDDLTSDGETKIRDDENVLVKEEHKITIKRDKFQKKASAG